MTNKLNDILMIRWLKFQTVTNIEARERMKVKLECTPDKGKYVLKIKIAENLQDNSTKFFDVAQRSKGFY